MISPQMAKIVQIMPKKVVVFLSKKIINHYLNKYAAITIMGKENLSNIQTPTVFICNHLSNSDGLILSKVLKDIDPTFVAGVKLSDNVVTNIGINAVKTTNIIPNTADKEGLKRTINLVKQGESILIFPEGTRSRVGSLIEAKKGIILIASMTGVPIVPIGLYGSEKLLPISQGGNMSSESFHHASVYVNIGEQFEFPKRKQGQDKKVFEEETSQFLMRRIAELLPEDYRGVYS